MATACAIRSQRFGPSPNGGRSSAAGDHNAVTDLKRSNQLPAEDHSVIVTNYRPKTPPSLASDCPKQNIRTLVPGGPIILPVPVAGEGVWPEPSHAAGIDRAGWFPAVRLRKTRGSGSSGDRDAKPSRSQGRVSVRVFRSARLMDGDGAPVAGCASGASARRGPRILTGTNWVNRPQRDAKTVPSRPSKAIPPRILLTRPIERSVGDHAETLHTVPARRRSGTRLPGEIAHAPPLPASLQRNRA